MKNNKFGQEYNAGRIDYRNDMGQTLQDLLTRHDATFEHNLSFKKFKENYGLAVRADAQFRDNTPKPVWEWKRSVLGQDRDGDVLCNPEDVKQTPGQCQPKGWWLPGKTRSA